MSIYIQVPVLSNFERHPFSISSGAEDKGTQMNTDSLAACGGRKSIVMCDIGFQPTDHYNVKPTLNQLSYQRCDNYMFFDLCFKMLLPVTYATVVTGRCV